MAIRNILMKIFATAFVVMQMAAVMPHHHHEFSDNPCINPIHALEVHAHEGAGHDHGNSGCGDEDCSSHYCLHNTCPHGHSGDATAPGNEAECGMGHLDLNPPVRDRIAFAAPVMTLPVSVIPTLIESLWLPQSDASADGGVVGPSVYSGTITLYSYICTSSIPARAPSFLV